MFVKFTEDVLGVDGFGTSFEITRESVKNIDLWIRDEHKILVIENKIKSGLNGKLFQLSAGSRSLRTDAI